MKKNVIYILLFLGLKAFSQSEIRTYAAANLSKPKDRFDAYKKTLNIEGGLGYYLGSIKVGNNFGIGIEPIAKLKWYGFEAINILRTDYSISTSEVGTRLYPVIKGKNEALKILNYIYIDVSYSKVKLVKVNIAVDEIEKMISYGYGINLPIKDFSDLGFASYLALNAGIQQYNWKTPSGTKSSFAGKHLGLSFAIILGGAKK
jgi:hypothetical protein